VFYLRSKVETRKLKFCAYCKLTYTSPNTQAHAQNSMCPPVPKSKSTEHDAAREAHVAVTCMTPDHVGQTHRTSWCFGPLLQTSSIPLTITAWIQFNVKQNQYKHISDTLLWHENLMARMHKFSKNTGTNLKILGARGVTWIQVPHWEPTNYLAPSYKIQSPGFSAPLSYGLW